MAQPPKTTLTPEELLARFSRIGRSVAAFARELGVHPQTVRAVLSGRKKGLRGDAHKVAVALGLKDGVIVDNEVSTTTALQDCNAPPKRPRRAA